MDLASRSPQDLGRSLSGLGINLLCRDVRATAGFLRAVFGLRLHRLEADFALLELDGGLLQLHSDRSFRAHPALGLVPEAGPRGGGVQIYLFGVDPDLAAERASAAGGLVIELPVDKPHGLREATILGPEGHAFSPAVARP
ncbi:MAG: VOC family protein [Alkalilacustris sp.]